MKDLNHWTAKHDILKRDVEEVGERIASLKAWLEARGERASK